MSRRQKTQVRKVTLGCTREGHRDGRECYIFQESKTWGFKLCQTAARKSPEQGYRDGREALRLCSAQRSGETSGMVRI